MKVLHLNYEGLEGGLDSFVSLVIWGGNFNPIPSCESSWTGNWVFVDNPFPIQPSPLEVVDEFLKGCHGQKPP
jgi:hypothetical protein